MRVSCAAGHRNVEAGNSYSQCQQELKVSLGIYIKVVSAWTMSGGASAFALFQAYARTLPCLQNGHRAPGLYQSSQRRNASAYLLMAVCVPLFFPWTGSLSVNNAVPVVIYANRTHHQMGVKELHDTPV